MEVSIMDNRRWWLRCAAAFASQLAILAILIATGRLVYATNDDTTMVAIASGGYGAPSQYVVFMHMILGYMLKFLFTICNGVNWVTVVFLFSDMLSVLVLDMVFASVKREKMGFVCTVIVLDVALLIVLAYFSFTVVAYWAGIAGLIGMTYAFMENVDHGHRLLTGICAGIAFVFCMMIRAEAVLSLVIVYASYIFVSLIFKRNWKPLVIALAAVCCMLVFKGSNAWMNDLNPVQRDYMAWTTARSAVVDYPMIPYDEADFSEKGITYNQHKAIYYGFFYDFDMVDMESMRALVEQQSSRYDVDVMGMLEKHFSLWDRVEQWRAFTSLYRILFAAVALFYLVFGRKQDYPLLFLTWGSTIAAECVFYFIRRPMYRVVMPGYLLAVILIMLYCGIDTQKERKLHLQGISTQRMTVVMTAVLMCGSIFTYIQHGDYQAWMYSNTERAVLDYMAENDDKVFLACDASLFGVEVSDSIWNHPGKRGIWNLIGGWETYSVPYFELMERQGIQDPNHVLREAIDSDKILLLTRYGDNMPIYCDWVLGLVEDNYHTKVEFEKVEDVSRTDLGSGYLTYSVYKLVTCAE